MMTCVWGCWGNIWCQGWTCNTLPTRSIGCRINVSTLADVPANLLLPFNHLKIPQTDRWTRINMSSSSPQPHSELDSRCEVPLDQNGFISVHFQFVVIASEGNRFAALCMTLGLVRLSVNRLKCNVGKASDNWRQHLMWVRKTRPAEVAAAMVQWSCRETGCSWPCYLCYTE